MSETDDLPRIPEDRIKPRPRKVSELNPGEQVALSAMWNLVLDREKHLWVDLSSEVMLLPLVPGMTLQAERTETGFILWLDKKVRFEPRQLRHKSYVPVVEIREAPED